MKKEKKMVRKAALIESGMDSSEVEAIVERFDAVDDETFAAMTEVLKMKKKKEDKNAMAEETTETKSEDLTQALENVEEPTDVTITVGSEDDSVQNTRAALVDFVCTRLGKKLNKGE
jgi:hypothetical protein